MIAVTAMGKTATLGEGHCAERAQRAFSGKQNFYLSAEFCIVKHGSLWPVYYT